MSSARYHIAGLELYLVDVDATLAALAALYAELDHRIDDYAADPDNPHLCHAGCSACCESSAFFALTLVEALCWTRGVATLGHAQRGAALALARARLDTQRAAFGGADAPGDRDDAELVRQIGALCRSERPSCPLLVDGGLCSTYDARPFLCRCYGAPVDAFASSDGDALTFHSLCKLYEGASLASYVPAIDLREELGALSRRLHPDRELGRFTSAEAIVAELRVADAHRDR